MIRNLVSLNIAELFERFSYYGVRSILVLFLTKSLLWDRSEAIDFYGMFTMIVYFASIIGGLLADLTRKPVLVAIIGNSLTTCGSFLLAASGSTPLVYAGVFAIFVGSGLFKPAIIGALWRVSFTQKHRFDLIFTVFYAVINLGAFCAPLVIGSIADTGNPDDFRIGFATLGVFSLVPTLLLGINYKNLQTNDLLYDNQSFKSNGTGIGNVVLCFVLSIIFWVTYQLLHTYLDPMGADGSTLIMTIVAFVFYFVMIPLHLIRNFRSAAKISIGLLLVAIVCIIYPIFRLPAMSGLVVLSIAEVMIIPVLWSQIIQNVSPKFTGIVMSLFMFMTVGINKASDALYDISYDDQPVILWVLAGLCFCLMGGFILLDHFQKQREQQSVQQLF